MLERVTELEPHDTFGSLQQRTEVYGFDLDAEEEETSCDSAGEGSSAQAIPAERLQLYCKEKAVSFLTSRKITAAEETFGYLEPQHRHLFVTSLISTALSSNDYADASLVGMLLSLESIRRLSREDDSIMQGFAAEVALLEDTVLDIPSAYRLTAFMLYACGVGQNAVETLSSQVIVEENDYRDRLVDEYCFLETDTEGMPFGSPHADLEASPRYDTDSEGQGSGEVSDVGYAL